MRHGRMRRLVGGALRSLVRSGLSAVVSGFAGRDLGVKASFSERTRPDRHFRTWRNLADFSVAVRSGTLGVVGSGDGTKGCSGGGPMKALTTAIAFSVIALAVPAQADIRCGHDLVQDGESTAQLLLVCGEPMLRQTVGVRETPEGEVLVERWTYNFGPGTLLQIVTVEGGKVAKVEDGARQ
jgi:hypothetical protein